MKTSTEGKMLSLRAMKNQIGRDLGKIFDYNRDQFHVNKKLAVEFPPGGISPSS